MAKEAGTKQAPERSDLKAFRGREPAKGDNDPKIDDPVEDNPNPKGETLINRGGNGADTGEEDAADDKAPEPKRHPSADDKRAKIFKRFEKVRAAETAEAAGDDPPEPGADNDADDDTKPRKSGASASAGEADDETPESIELEVNGKTLKKTLAEVAKLADLSEDEVRENPDRAIRYAQRELATKARLDHSKELSRRAQGGERQNSERTDDPPRRGSAQHQGEEESGDDDAHDRSGTSRNTTDDDDLKTLVEAIQVDPPEEAAKKLGDFIGNAVKRGAQQVMSEQDQSRAIRADMAQTTGAILDLQKDHPELKGNEIAASAIAAGLIAEYRTDIRKALLAEGNDEDDVDDMLAKSSPSDIATAHQRRRVGGDPNVRRIDKSFVESAYKRVQKQFGTGNKQTEQELRSRRDERKRELPIQPKQRSAMPPAGRPQAQGPVDETALRKKAVQQMKQGRRLQPATR